MPMPLLAPRNELLAEMASYFKHDSDINALMRANTRLYHLLNSYLYQHNARFFGELALSWTARSGYLAGARKGSQFNESELLDFAILSRKEETVSLLLESDMGTGPKEASSAGIGMWEESDNEGESEVEDHEGKDKQQYQFYRWSSLTMALIYGNEAVVQVLIKHIRTLLEQKDRVSTQLHVSETDGTPLQQFIDWHYSKQGRGTRDS